MTNLTLTQSGTTLATAAGIGDKDLIVFSFTSPFLIDKGNSRVFEVFGDIGSTVKNNDTIKLYVDEKTDVFAVGRTFNQGVQVLIAAADTGGNGFDGAADSSDADVTVEGGQITITFNGPAAKDVAPDAEDIELTNFTVTSQNNVEVRDMKIRLTTSGDANNYDDIKIVNVTKGIVVMGPTDTSTSASTSNITFTDRFNMNAGESNVYSIRVDVAASGTAGLSDGETVRIDLGQGSTAPFSGSSIRNLDNNQFVATTDIVPSGVITGNTSTIRTTSLTLSLAGTPTSQTFVRGTSNVDLVGFNLKAGVAQDITITQINTTMYGDDTTAGVFVAGQVTTTTSASSRTPSVWLVDKSTGAQVGLIKSVNSTTGIAQFSSLNFTIPAGQTKTLTVRANLDASALSNSDSDLVKVDIPATTDVTARDPQGNSVTIGSAAPNGGTADSGTRITIADTGSISVALAPDDTESEAGLIVAGKSNVILAKYRFTAQNEEMKVTKVQFSVSSTSLEELTGVTVWDGATQIGSSVTPTLATASGTAAFTGLGFVVPKDASKTLTVKGNLNTTSAGATSGDEILVSLDDANFEARGTGAGSSTVLTETDLTGEPLNANTKYFRKTVPTITFSTGDLLLTTGEKTLMKITIAADASEQISVRTFNFTLSVDTATFSTTADNFKIREAGNLLTSTSTNSQNSATITLTSESTIAAGASKTYEILGTVTSIGSGSASVTVKMEQSTAEVGPLAEQAAATGATLDLTWSDNSAIPHSLTSTDWYNGFEAKNLPSSTFVLSKS